MAAPSCNYIISYDKISQVYAAASEKVALASPPPKDCSIEDKRIFFISFNPDEHKLVAYEIDRKEVLEAYKSIQEAKLEEVGDDD